MEDSSIVQLYFDRSEQAITETDRKYGPYCFHIAYSILLNNEDAEESVSDTYLAAWNAIPPGCPGVLATFLGKITRHLSIDRWRSRYADKRGGGEVPIALDELGECVAGGRNVEGEYARKELYEALNRLLDTLSETERRVFLCRYWYLDSTAHVAETFGFSESKVKSMLHRVRIKLRRELEKEGLL